MPPRTQQRSLRSKIRRRSFIRLLCRMESLPGTRIFWSSIPQENIRFGIRSWHSRQSLITRFNSAATPKCWPLRQGRGCQSGSGSFWVTVSVLSSGLRISFIITVTSKRASWQCRRRLAARWTIALSLFRALNMDVGLRTRRNSFSIKITSFRWRVSPSAKLRN